MNRLREERPTDPITEEAARLLHAVTPPAPSALTEARIWARLRAERSSRRASRLRPLLALGLLILLGALASAAALTGWRPWRPTTTPTPTTPTQAGGHARHASDAVAAVQPIVVPLPAGDTVPVAAGAPDAMPSGAKHHVRRTVVPPSLASVEAKAPTTEVDPGVQLLHQATGALRRHHDPTRAAQLADEYLSLFPDGDLLEEALALSLQAHVALDDDRASALAARYLSRYPNGRFRAEALRAR